MEKCQSGLSLWIEDSEEKMTKPLLEDEGVHDAVSGSHPRHCSAPRLTHPRFKPLLRVSSRCWRCVSSRILRCWRDLLFSSRQGCNLVTSRPRIALYECGIRPSVNRTI
jgi:hypothetical protein